MKEKQGGAGGRPGGPPPHGMGGMGRGFGGGGSTAGLDAAAKLLGLTPAELLTELHSGKTMEQVATNKGVDFQKVMEASKAVELAEHKTRLAQAVKDGKMTQAQADQMLKDMAQGRMPGGPGRGGPGGPPQGGSGASQSSTSTKTAKRPWET